MDQRDFVAEMDLETRVGELEQRLAALTEEAAKNEAILKSSQAREMKLLEAESLDTLLLLLTQGLEDSYRLEAVSLVLCDPYHKVRHLLWSDGISPDSVPGLRFVDTIKHLVSEAGDFTQPRLGPYKRRSHRCLFPQADRLGSVALMPLHHLATIASFCMENVVNRACLVRSGLTDVLTGMHNRRYLQDRLRGELASAHRTQTPLACLILDADHFKRVNDEHGHLAGDSVLREIARRVITQIRANDVGARFGGEEFAVLLPGTSTEVAAKLGERIRESISRTPVELSDEQRVAVSVSVGVASVIPARNVANLDRVADDLFAAADAALYQAKQDGRNCVRRGDCSPS
jgi:diguanylate cyclase (GGDEF)-like protein